MTDPSGTPNTPPPAYPAAPAPAPGAPAAGAPAPGAPVPGKTMGIVALILAFFIQIVGLILGIVALVQSRKAGAKNTPAVWAIILSVVFMVIWTVVGIVIAIGIGAAADLYQQCLDMGGGTQIIDGIQVTCN
jgi:heme/copper-type cytochrome/quinol oxidase subunit 2